MKNIQSRLLMVTVFAVFLTSMVGCYYYPDRDRDGYSADELQNRHVVRDRRFGDRDFGQD